MLLAAKTINRVSEVLLGFSGSTGKPAQWACEGRSRAGETENGGVSGQGVGGRRQYVRGRGGSHWH